MNPEYENGYEGQPEQTPFMYPMPQVNEFMTEGSMKFQLDQSDIISIFSHSILGFEKRKNSKTGADEWAQTSKSIINKEGMQVMVSILEGRLTKIFKLTRLDEEVIAAITISCGRNLWDMMFLNYLNWEVKDIAHAKLIIDYITDSIYATLCAAKDGEYLMFLRTTQKIHEIQSFQQNPYKQAQQQQQGFASKIPLIGRLFR